jgi:hypothetical protein
MFMEAALRDSLAGLRSLAGHLPGGFAMRNGVGAEWPFLAGPGRIVQRDLDIAEYTDPARDKMVPHTIVSEPGLIVYRIETAIATSGALRSRSCAKTRARCS